MSLSLLTSDTPSPILYTMKPKQLKEAKDAEYMTVEEAGKELGVQTNAIRNYLHYGKMDFYKFKTLTLIRRADVEAWKERQK